MEKFSLIRFVPFATFFILICLTSSVYSEIEPLKPVSDASEEYIETYYKKAADAYNRKEYEASLTLIRHVIQSNLKHPKLRYLAAHNYWALKKFDPARSHFKVFLDATPELHHGYTALALLELENDDYKSSLDTAQKGLQILTEKKDFVPIRLLNVMARAYLYQENFAQTLEIVANAKKKFPDKNQRVEEKVETLMLEARAYWLTQKYAKSEVSILWALELIPENEYGLNLLGCVYKDWSEDMKDTSEKEAMLEKAKESYQKALYYLDESSSLYQLIQSHLNKF